MQFTTRARLRVTPTGVITLIIGLVGVALAPLIAVPALLATLAVSGAVHRSTDNPRRRQTTESLMFAAAVVLLLGAILAFVLMPSPFWN